jgi:malate synthase
MTTSEFTKLLALYIVGVGPEGIPNGHLYARRMVDGVTLEIHTALVNDLIRQGIFKQSNFFITLTDKGLGIHGKLQNALLTPA